MDKSAKFLRRPATLVGNGRLHRAIVSLPRSMASGALEERVVFFETQSEQRAECYLEELLEKVWCVDTKGWCEDGLIYNVYSALELHRFSVDDSNGPTDIMLFEIGGGGTGIEAIGHNRTHYAQADTIDMFVTPRVTKRLRDALEVIELMRIDEPRRRREQ